MEFGESVGNGGFQNLTVWCLGKMDLRQSRFARMIKIEDGESWLLRVMM